MRLFVVAFAVLSTGACGGGSDSNAPVAPPPPPPPTMSIQVPAVVVTAGTLPATASVSNSTTPTVTWSSDSPGVATVGSDGTITGVSPGQSLIRATSGSLTASASVNIIPRFTELGLGIRWGCGITAAADLYCWGQDTQDQLGVIEGRAACPLQPSNTCVQTPRQNSAALPFVRVNGGFQNTCGLTASGQGYCWGGNFDCAAPDPTFPKCGWLGAVASYRTPLKVSGELQLTSIGAGGDFVCMLTDAGAAYCIGINLSGILGTAATQRCGISVAAYACSDTAIAISGGISFASLSVGAAQVCGLTAAGAAHCWGANGNGQAGIGASGPNLTTPTAVVGGLQFSSISAGTSCFVADPCGYHTCAITAAGQAYCWGFNGYGELGNASTVDSYVPVAVSGGLTFSSISVGGAHTCGLTTSGRAYCWGFNTRGSLGDGTNTNRSVPTPVARSIVFAQLDSRANLSCGRTASGTIYCWGNNAFGQLGAGLSSVLSVNTPVGIGVP